MRYLLFAVLLLIFSYAHAQNYANFVIDLGTTHNYLGEQIVYDYDVRNNSIAGYIGSELAFNKKKRPLYISIGAGAGFFTMYTSEVLSSGVKQKNRVLYYISVIPRINYRIAHHFDAGLGAGIALQTVPGTLSRMARMKLVPEAYAGYASSSVSFGMRCFGFVPGTQTYWRNAPPYFGNWYNSFCTMLEVKIRIASGDDAIPD